MKFRKEKKDKMRKHRISNIRRSFDYNGSFRSWTDWETGEVYETVDKAMFRGEHYLLVKSSDGYGIYKMVSDVLSESVKLSNKKLIKDRKTFESPSIWKRKSEIKISDNGNLTSVEVAKHEKPPLGGGKVVIRIYGAY